MADRIRVTSLMRPRITAGEMTGKREPDLAPDALQGHIVEPPGQVGRPITPEAPVLDQSPIHACGPAVYPSLWPWRHDLAPGIQPSTFLLPEGNRHEQQVADAVPCSPRRHGLDRVPAAHRPNRSAAERTRGATSPARMSGRKNCRLRSDWRGRAISPMESSSE